VLLACCSPRNFAANTDWSDAKTNAYLARIPDVKANELNTVKT
jgi:hypothetical protein